MFEKLFEWFTNLSREDDRFEVTVKKGDSLWAIADHITGDGERWRELVEANPGRTFSADFVIEPGEKLHIPESWADDHG